MTDAATTDSLDATMEAASVALAAMDYLTCEAKCLDALTVARQRGDWAYYARVLLPLQEARRQRRMIAAEGVVRLGSADLIGGLGDWLGESDAGCIVLTHPHTAGDAAAMVAEARDRRQYVEVLWADCPSDSDPWRLVAFQGGRVARDVPAPPAAWRDRTFKAGQAPSGPSGSGPPQPADWFLDASEALGDAALSDIDPNLPTRMPREQVGPALVQQLEACLGVVTDHEFIHQRLGDAARALRLETA